MAAQCDGYSACCSNTSRTARSRTSGENRLFLFVMAPFSQDKEPPRIPGRFILPNLRRIFLDGLSRLRHVLISVVRVVDAGFVPGQNKLIDDSLHADITLSETALHQGDGFSTGLVRDFL